METENNNWKSWIELQLDNRKKIYSVESDELTSAYRREELHRNDYHGRELFELIQNADDAGKSVIGGNKLLISYFENCLIIANTGSPFTQEGIKSLMISDNSPKHHEDSGLIGHKGLGFRALLNWSTSLLIFSGNSIIEFDKTKAHLWLEKLKTEDKTLQDKLSRQKIANPIPILSVPSLLIDINDNQSLSKPAKEKIKEIKKSYDTVLCFVITEKNTATSEIEQQLSELKPETFLFLNHLKDINIESPFLNIKWAIERNKGKSEVKKEDGSIISYKIFYHEGIIPEKHLEESSLKNKYQIKLAFPEKEMEPENLFVFFPTGVEFPFQFLAHVTFEVEANRKALNDSPANRFISKKLAQFIVHSAESFRNKDAPWQAYSYLIPNSDFSNDLKKLNFQKHLENSIKSHRLFPNIKKEFCFINEIKNYPINCNELSEFEVFSDSLFEFEKNKNTVFLSLPQLLNVEYSGLKDKLNEISKSISLDIRADLIYQLINRNLIPDDMLAPDLLIEESGKLIKAENTIFLPSSQPIQQLPEWTFQSIISSDLQKTLLSKIKTETDSKEVRLYQELTSFNVREYNLAGLAGSLFAKSNEFSKKNPTQENKYRTEILPVIYDLYTNATIKTPLSDVNISLPNRRGGYTVAKELYFGEDYIAATINEKLYSKIETTDFIASASILGFKGDEFELLNFIEWLGVSKTPRMIKKVIRKTDPFFKYATSIQTYPFVIRDNVVNTNEDYDRYHSEIEVLYLEKLEEIIEVVDFHTLLGCISKEQELLRKSGGKFFIAQGKQEWRTDESIFQIPSYSLWLVKNTSWFQISNSNEKKKPTECCYIKGNEEFSKWLGSPNIDVEKIITLFGVSREYIYSTLILLGVVNNLNDISWELFYTILENVGKEEPLQSSARIIYQKLLERDNVNSPPKLLQDFKNNGKMLASCKGKLEMIPTDKVFYISNRSLPEKILADIPLLEMDIRKNSLKIKQLFGVETLNNDSFSTKVEFFEENILNYKLQLEINELKYFVYSLRVNEDNNNSNRSILSKLKIVLCKTLIAKTTIGGTEEKIDLKNGDMVYEENTAYIYFDESPENIRKLADDLRILEDDFVADSVGEIMSNFLKVSLTDKVARIAKCNPSQRIGLLNRLTGDQGETRLKKAKENFQKREIIEYFVFIPPVVTNIKPEEEDIQSEATTGDSEKTSGDENSNENDLANKFDYSDLPEVDVESIAFERIEGQPVGMHSNSNKGKGGGSGGGKFGINKFSKEDGDRGEGAVMMYEKKRIALLVSKLNLSPGNYKPYHISKDKPFNPWDIESFDEEENTGSLVPIRIEVKSTPNPSNSQFEMSQNEFKNGLLNSHPKGKYCIYRVLNVRTASPSIEVFDFKKEFERGCLKVSNKQFYVTINTVE